MIHVEDLHKSYGDLQALKGISFDVPTGQVVGFLGPNGAGKTTTMKILTGFIPASEGTVQIAGYNGATDALEIKKKIGYLPESTPLYSDMTAYDYLDYVAAMRELPRTERKERIHKVAKTCGATAFLDQIIGTLSKGQRQRVGLAQAMIHDPPILILDEPTSGLDPNQIVEIRFLIKKLGESRTILLSTHNLAEVKLTCDRVIIIHEGNIVKDGILDELEKHHGEQGTLTLEIGRPADSSPDGAHITEQISALEGVKTVTLEEENDRLLFQIEVTTKDDVRPALHGLIVREGWTLYALYLNTIDLEGLFRGLTQEQ